MSVCLGVVKKMISLTDGPIRLSFTVKLLIGLGKFLGWYYNTAKRNHHKKKIITPPKTIIVFKKSCML